MLNLAPPLLQFGRITFFSDYADPTQFFYLPNFPHIALTEDGRPAAQLLVFRQDLDTLPDTSEDAVAFVSLDVDLSFPEEELKKARSQLQIALNLATEPTLSPIFFRRGSVRLLLLDAKTPEPGHEKDPVDPSEFVARIYGSGSPSLYGDNRAIFQASMTKKGAAALSACFEGFMPIGVVYELTFAGLQPAYHIKIRADWHKVYTHFSEREDFNSIFYEHDVVTAIDKLIEDQVIKVDDVIEGVDDEAMKPDHDAVMNDLRHYIMDTFFKATLDKDTPAGQGTGDQVAGVLTQIAAAPFSMFGKYTYQRKEMTDDELRVLDVDWSVRKAVERTIYPQAHLSTLFAASQLKKDDVIKVVDGAAALWKEIAFDVSADAAWDRDGIDSITVDVEYGGAPSTATGDAGTGASSSSSSSSGTPIIDTTAAPVAWSMSLTKAASRQKRRAWYDPSAAGKIRYRYQVFFISDGVPGPDLHLDSGWLEHEGTVLVVQPASLYRIVEAEADAIANFPFDRYPAVHAFFRYADEGSDYAFKRDAVIAADAKKFATHCRARAASTAAVEARLQFQGAGSAPAIDTGWAPLDGNTLLVADPQPSKLVIRVIPTGDRTKIANLVVNIEYRDDAHNLLQSEPALVFDPSNINKPQEWSVPLMDILLRTYRYRVTLVYTDGTFLATDWIESRAPTLLVGELYMKLLEVEVSLQGARAAGVDRIQVKLDYDDAVGNVHEHQDVTLLSAGDTSLWRIKLADGQKQTYRYTVTWAMSDGFDRKLGPLTSTERFLVIPSTPPAS